MICISCFHVAVLISEQDVPSLNTTKWIALVPKSKHDIYFSKYGDESAQERENKTTFPTQVFDSSPRDGLTTWEHYRIPRGTTTHVADAGWAACIDKLLTGQLCLSHSAGAALGHYTICLAVLQQLWTTIFALLGPNIRNDDQVSRLSSSWACIST